MNYSLLIVPFTALIITQIIKLIIHSKNGKFSIKNFDSYGGMPSSHAAFMGAALTQAGQQYGISSGIFAVIAFLAFVVLRDAIGIRQTIGQHAEMINEIVTDLPDNVREKYPHLEPRFGHTHTQVAVGLILGCLMAIIL